MDEWTRIPRKAGGRVLGISGSKIYELAARHAGLLKKVDDITLLNVRLLSQIIETSPNAKITAPANTAED